MIFAELPNSLYKSYCTTCGHYCTHLVQGGEHQSKGDTCIHCPTLAPEVRVAHRRARLLPTTVRDLSREEARELSWARTRAWLDDRQAVAPFTPEEARYHAKEFIVHNGRNNLVRLLAEAFLELQDRSTGA